MAEDRLQKILAQAGVASRRGAEKLIAAGRVKVNGRVVDKLGTKADPETDLIEVDRKLIAGAEGKAYYLFNKPAGYITSLRDPKGRPTVASFLTEIPERVYPVGRLDNDAEGLLVLTNDGELARRLMHPRFHVPKTYRVKIEGKPSLAAVTSLADGKLMLGDRPAAPAEVEVIKWGKDRTWILLTLIEGRHHQVKRMCSQIGHPVMKLKRVAYGPLTLGRLAPGRLRPLKPAEIRDLKRAAGLTGAERGRRSKKSTGEMS